MNTVCIVVLACKKYEKKTAFLKNEQAVFFHILLYWPFINKTYSVWTYYLLTFILLFNTNNLLCYINILLILLINYDISEFIFIY